MLMWDKPEIFMKYQVNSDPNLREERLISPHTNNCGESTINLLVRKDDVEQPDKQFNKKSPKGLLPGSFSYLLLIESVAIEARANFTWEKLLSLPTQSLIIYSKKSGLYV